MGHLSSTALATLDRTRRLLLMVALTLTGVVPAWAQGEVIEYYHTDVLGSVRVVTNEQGQVVARHDYFPFGEEYAPQPGNDQMRFTSKERDRETSLDYFGARYYAQRTGRFTTVDPMLDVEASLFSPQRFARYAYAGNNPLRYVDPNGEDFLDRVSGFVNAVGSNFFLNRGRVEPTNSDFAGGQKAGDLASMFLGLAEIQAGQAGLGGSAALAVTGVGTLPAVGSGALSAGVMAHGAAVTVVASAYFAKSVDIHHIATNKNSSSTAAGGPYTPRLEEMFERGGLSLDDPINKMPLPGHKGPHPDYNRVVYERLANALKGLKGSAYNVELRRQLGIIRRLTATEGTELNLLATGG